MIYKTNYKQRTEISEKGSDIGVKTEDSQPRGRGFESWHFILYAMQANLGYKLDKNKIMQANLNYLTNYYLNFALRKRSI